MIESSIKYPKVLIVLMQKVKAYDPQNMLIRTQFGEWPKERLAQIHATGDASGYGTFLNSYYCLDEKDRVFGCVFKRMRGGIYDMTSPDPISKKNEKKNYINYNISIIKKKIADIIIRSGLWELIFRVRMSTAMSNFIKDFNPDLIYCQGYSLGFSTLPVLIAAKFNIPICYQTTDDWPSYTYNNPLMSWILNRSVAKLVSIAKVRLAFGEKMRSIYEERYNVSFDVTYHLDDTERFKINISESNIDKIKIVYTGSLALKRYEAILDILSAIKNIDLDIEIDIYTSGLPKDIPRLIMEAQEISIYALPKHSDLPKILSKATILFLPESFTVPKSYIGCSISSKAHLYMMSNKPIIVYGPSYSGTVSYAKEKGWATVVDKKNINDLKASVLSTLFNEELIKKQRLSVLACIEENHNIRHGQRKFVKLLKKT